MSDTFDAPLPTPEAVPDQLRNSPHWITCKYEPRPDGKLAKIPCDHHGHAHSFHHGHTTLDVALANAEELRQKYGTNFGVGYAFTDGCGIVALDIDAAIADGVRAEHLNFFLNEYPTWAELSVSSTGAHLFYAGDFAAKKIATSEGHKVEIFGTVGFIAFTGRVVPGSPMHLAPFAKVNEVLAPFIEKRPEPPPARPVARRKDVTDSTLEAWGRAGLERQCDILRTAPKGTIHNTMIRCATSVGRLVPHAVDREDAAQALLAAAVEAGHQFPARADKYIRGQIDFGSTGPSFPAERPGVADGVDLSNFYVGKKRTDVSEEETYEPAPSGPADPGPFPPELLTVPGFIGDVVAYTNANSQVLQPTLALAGALSLMSVVVGRRVKDVKNTRPNLYVLGVAQTGHGKDAARTTNKVVLNAAGMDRMLGEAWASGPGLVSAVAANPSILFQIDEMGQYLHSLGQAKHAPHLLLIVPILLRLYSSAGTVFIGDSYADAKKQITIQQPNAVIYGTTTPRMLYKSLSEESIASGFMGRLLIFETPDQRGDDLDNDATPPPAELVAVVKRWHDWNPGGGNLALVNPTPHTVPTTDAANAVFVQLRKASRDQEAVYGPVLGPLWARAVENARKLAMLYACSEKFGEDAVVDTPAAEWACSLVQYLVKRMCFKFAKLVSRNETEGRSKEVERHIEDAGANGITTKELTRVTRDIKPKDLRDIVDGLKQAGLVVDGKRSAKFKPFSVLVHTRILTGKVEATPELVSE